MLVSLGELSSGRQALEGRRDGSQKPGHVECVAGSNQEASTCPSTIAGQGHDTRSPVGSNWTNTSSVVISSPARRGAATGPSGMTKEHLRPLLDDVHATHLFFQVGVR